LKKYLVSGANGFVGIPLCQFILQQGHSLRVIVRNPFEKLKVEQIICDLVSGLIDPNVFLGIDTVLHLAAYTHDAKEANKVAHIYKQINTEATIQLAKLAVESGVKRFVFVSSVKAGGSARKGECADEQNVGEPEGIYGLTKREAEIKLLKIGEDSGMQVSIVRPALVYGPQVKGNLKVMLAGIKKGWFPPLPKTNNVRSMVHVDDLVSAILLASTEKAAVGEIYIVTDGKRYSSREIYDEMRKAVGRSSSKWCVPKFVFYALAKLGDLIGKVRQVPFDSYKYKKLLLDDCYDSSKIREQLNFESKFVLSDVLPEMIKSK